MITFPIEHYIKRREECLAAAGSAKLANEKKRHLDAADAWQDIIDKLTTGRHRSHLREALRSLPAKDSYDDRR